MLPLIFLDDNVLDPISRKGQENVYAQLENLLASLEPELEKGFTPRYSIEAFFERLGKEGDFWDGFDIYKNTAMPKKTFEDGEAIAAAVGTIQKQLETNIRNEPFFSKNNLKSLYDASKAGFVGNQLSGDLLNLTFYRYGDHLFSPDVDHWPFIIPDLVWDRLVAFPVAWSESNGVQGVPDAEAQKAWKRAEKFYDCLTATYHNQNGRLLGAAFARLTLQRYLVFCVLSLKRLKWQVKQSKRSASIPLTYQMERLQSWVNAHRLAFKKNSDLLDIRLLHCALYGFVPEKGSKKEPISGICVTCDPVGDVEARLSLSVGAHKMLSEQVDGWNLPLCAGKIICLKYENRTFVHVKTIDVKCFIQEYYGWKNKWTGWKFNTKLFGRIVWSRIKHLQRSFKTKLLQFTRGILRL